MGYIRSLRTERKHDMMVRFNPLSRRDDTLRYIAALKRQHGETVPLPRSSNSKRSAGLEFEKHKIFFEHRQVDNK